MNTLSLILHSNKKKVWVKPHVSAEKIKRTKQAGDFYGDDEGVGS
ncbi:MAG TPA: hypothetical protein PK825_05425 [Bacteroidales bacterium]|nr:hypothetical protein [Bacteroidales bacterium]